AEVALRSSLKIGKTLARASPCTAAYRAVLAETHQQEAHLHHKQGQLRPAEERCRQALELRRRLADEMTGPRPQEDLAASYDTLGQILDDQHRPEEAEQAYRPAVAIRRRLVEVAPEVPEYRCRLGGVLHNLAGALAQLNRLAEA